MICCSCNAKSALRRRPGTSEILVVKFATSGEKLTHIDTAPFAEEVANLEHPVDVCPFAQPEENEHIEEVHAAQYEHYSANLNAEDLYYLPCIIYITCHAQRRYRIPYVYQVEANHQQIVYRICQLLIAMKNVDEEYFTVFK